MKWIWTMGCLFSAACAFGAPWSALLDYDAPAEKTTSVTRMQCRRGERYLLGKILAGETVRAALVNDVRTPDEQYQKVIVQAYNAWFENALTHIRSSRREAEFSDLLPVFQKGVQIQFVKWGENPDIVFYVVPQSEIAQLCGSSAAACYKRGSPPFIYMPKEKALFLRLLNPVVNGKHQHKKIFIHEIGHSLGLGDQYFAGNQNAHALYSTDQPQPSVMNDARGGLSCDDADGIINLADITLCQGRGGEIGWRSFCKKPGYQYVQGIAVGKGPYIISFPASGQVADIILSSVKDGREYPMNVFWGENEGVSPFKPFAETVVLRDAAGRPARSVGPEGEDVYYSYVFGAERKLVVKNSSIVQFSMRRSNRKKDKVQSFLLPTGPDTVRRLDVSTERGVTTIVLVESDINDESYSLLKTRFSGKGEILDEFWESSQDKQHPPSLPRRANGPKKTLQKASASVLSDSFSDALHQQMAANKQNRWRELARRAYELYR